MLVTGVYGSGKSTVIADIGALLESRGARYAVLDVDWLGWFDTGAGPQANRRVTLSNLRAICTTYLDIGVLRLVWRGQYETANNSTQRGWRLACH